MGDFWQLATPISTNPPALLVGVYPRSVASRHCGQTQPSVPGQNRMGADSDVGPHSLHKYQVASNTHSNHTAPLPSQTAPCTIRGLSPEAGCPKSPRQLSPVKPRAVPSPRGLLVLGDLPRQQHTSPHFHVGEASSDLADARWSFHLVPGEGEKREGGQGPGPGRTDSHDESRSTEAEDQDAGVPCCRGRSELGRG